jgi:hypothetical protein
MSHVRRVLGEQVGKPAPKVASKATSIGCGLSTSNSSGSSAGTVLTFRLRTSLPSSSIAATWLFSR